MQKSINSFFKPPPSKRQKPNGVQKEEVLKVEAAGEDVSEASVTSVDTSADSHVDTSVVPTKSRVDTPTVPVDTSVKTPADTSVKTPMVPTDTPAVSAVPTVPSDTSVPVEIPYSLIAETFNKIEKTTKRLEIARYCADLYLEVLQKTNGDAHQLAQCVYLCINRLGPDYEGLELGLGESLIMKALAESTGRSLPELKKQYAKLGDLGEIAVQSKRSQTMMFSKPKPLMVNYVFQKLKEIAQSSGKESQQKKTSIIKSLLVNCQNLEAKYLIRSLEGKLRIGLAEKTVLTALSQAFIQFEGSKLSLEDGEEKIKNAFSQIPNYELVISAALRAGLADLNEHIKLTPGVPLKPMLAKPTKSITEVLNRFQNRLFTCEYKYDGERAQVHCSNGKMHVYSRNMEDMSSRYPDIIDILPHIPKTLGTDFILDCEAVAYDRKEHKILPFQVLSTRKRKDVVSGEISVRVHLFAFDLLYLNGESLLAKPLKYRRDLLKSNFNETEGEFAFATSMDTSELDEIQVFLDESVKNSCEGLMVKALEGSESKYEPSKRSLNWLKIKKDYLNGVGDSLDLVVLGAYYGKGRRTNVYGGFLLGCYNPDEEEYETVCKIGTGFSDEMLAQLYKELSPLATSKRAYIQHVDAANQQPDIWFEPKHVWEVKAADLSLSPVYQAGRSEIDQKKGVSLRFPRFIRAREDKDAEDSTSSSQIVQMYYDQPNLQG